VAYRPTLDETIRAIVPADAIWRDRARERLGRLTMPHWALGRLMDLAADLAAGACSLNPPTALRTVVTFAADHGVARSGVSLYPQEVTGQMVLNFLRGGAGVNALARVSGARIIVVNMGIAGDFKDPEGFSDYLSRSLGPGTDDLSVGPAMSRDKALRAVEIGIEIAQSLDKSCDVFGTGDMGIGNTTSSSAIIATMTGAGVTEVVGRGTGINDDALRLKQDVVGRALEVNRPDPSDALDVLSKVGGFEIGGIAGLILGAASLKRPVLIDGLISTAGALIAQGLSPVAADYMIAAHKSVEPGHVAALARLGKTPLMDLGMRLGEGTGAALAMCLVEAAARILTEVATFEEAAVSTAVETGLAPSS
jgi:nicotinate-nucleotide--dimethylbenzimidazole phosphoribosyltransferase